MELTGISRQFALSFWELKVCWPAAHPGALRVICCLKFWEKRMSQVIWVGKLFEAKMDESGDQFDKPFILKFSKKIDTICRKNKIIEISTFFDSTAIQAEMTDDYQGFEDGYRLLEAKGKWFEPSDGITAIEKLLDVLKEKRVKFGTLSDRYNEIINELKNCLDQVKDIESRNGKFNFCIVS